MKCEEGIGADLLHEDDQSLAKGGRSFDELAALEEVVRARWILRVAAVLVAALLHDGEVPVLGVLRHFEVERGVVDCLLDDRVRRNVGDLFAAVEDGSVVADGVNVLLRSSETHVAEVVLAGGLPRANTVGPDSLAASGTGCREQRNRPRWSRGLLCVCSALQSRIRSEHFLPRGAPQAPSVRGNR